MIKVKATIQFRDLKENKLRRVGDTFEVSESRYNEILEKGGNWIEKDYSDFTVKELKAELDKREIEYSVGDKKADLLKKLGD